MPRRARRLVLLATAAGGAAALALAPTALGQGGGLLSSFQTTGELTVSLDGSGEPVGITMGAGDTIIRRLPSRPGGGRDTIDIELVALSLQSAAPVSLQVGPTFLYAGSEVGFPVGTVPGLGPPGSPTGFPNSIGQLNGLSFIDFQGQVASPQYPLRTTNAAADQAGATTLAFARTTSPVRLRAGTVDSYPPNAPQPVPPAALRGNHYKCYSVIRSFTERRVRQVLLRDQFGRVRGSTAEAVEVCNPVQKIYRNKTTRIRDTRRHLVAYRLNAPGQQPRNISAQNQLGNQRLTTGKLTTLLLPAQKVQLQGTFRRIPRRTSTRVLDHYACYQANRRANRPRSVVLADQFESRTNVIPRNRAINGFCNPTRKTYNKKTTNIRNPQAHLTSYRLTGRRKSGQRTVRVQTQFGRYRVITGNATRLLVPSAKRYCATFSARTNLPYVAANGQRFGTVTGIALTPYGGHPRGACPRT